MSKRAIGIASIIYGVTILASRLIGLIREAIIGRILGAGSEADVYWTSFILPDFLNYLLAGGILSIAFIPIFQRKRLESEAEAARLFRTLFNALFLIVTALTIVLWLITPKLTPFIAPGLEGESRSLLNHLVRIILPAQIFHICGALISATLQAQDRHIFPAIAPVVYTLSIVLGGICLGDSMGAEGFAWGVLAGSILGPFLCPLIGAFRAGLTWRPTMDLKDGDVRRYFVVSLPIMLGVSVVVLDDMLVKRFASLLPENGSIAQLQYARTLMKVPMGIFGLAAGMATFPTLSRLFAEEKHQQAHQTLADSLRVTMLLAFIAQAGLSCSATEVATVIWGRTNFSSDMLEQIGLLTTTYSLGLWAWSVQGLVARGFYAQGNTWTPTVIGSILMFLWLPIYQMGGTDAVHLSLTSSGVISVYVLALSWMLVRGTESPWKHFCEFWRPLPTLMIVTAFSIGVTNWIKSFLPTLSSPFFTGLTFGLSAIAFAVFGLYLLGNRELKILVNLLKKRFGRKSSA